MVKTPFVSGEYETLRGDHRVAEGPESRREAPRVWGRRFTLPKDGVRGVTPGKILKFETQFGAIWCILARN